VKRQEDQRQAEAAIAETGKQLVLEDALIAKLSKDELPSS
jgi:hypothetical protein